MRSEGLRYIGATVKDLRDDEGKPEALRDNDG
jgi:hypothetical protein